jgi:hypothetical protein
MLIVSLLATQVTAPHCCHRPGNRLTTVFIPGHSTEYRATHVCPTGHDINIGIAHTGRKTLLDAALAVSNLPLPISAPMPRSRCGMR